MARSLVTLSVLALAPLAACSSPEEMQEQMGIDGQATAAAQTPEEDTDGPARSIAIENDLYAFKFAYPASLGEIPALQERLDDQAQREETSLERLAGEARSTARAEGFPYNRYFVSIQWDMAGQTPRWLSLVEKGATYFGGAHGNFGLSSVLWNRESQRLLKPINLFESREALAGVLSERFCEGLDAARLERRGVETFEPDAIFDACPSFDELEVVLYSNGQGFDRIMLYAGPYVAGPYAEGAYEIELDVDEATLEAVKERYREDFVA